MTTSGDDEGGGKDFYDRLLAKQSDVSKKSRKTWQTARGRGSKGQRTVARIQNKRETSRRWGQYPAQPIVAPEGEPATTEGSRRQVEVGAMPGAANRGTGGGANAD